MKNLINLSILCLFLFASCKNQDSKVSENNNTESVTTSTINTRIVYVNQDSLLEQYDLYKENKIELEADSKKAQNSISSKLEAFQRKVEKFQQKVYETQQTAASIAPIELQKLQEKFSKEQESLARQEQKLVQQRDNAALELDQKIIDLQITLKDKIDTYLTEVAIEKGYDFVLIKGTGGGVLYGNSALDITESVVSNLNTRYQAEGK
jgi:outer membrane protein